MFEAHPRQVNRYLRTSDPMVTHYYGLAIGIEFRHTRGNLPHRNIGCLGKGREHHFLRFAHVQDKWPVAPIDAGLQIGGGDFIDRGHGPMITSGAAARYWTIASG